MSSLRKSLDIEISSISRKDILDREFKVHICI